MSLFEHHIFICVNERVEDDPKGSCSRKGSQEILEAFRQELRNQGLKAKVRANKAGCLSQCALGPTVVIYPEAVWYQKVQVKDVPKIVETMLKD